MLPQPNFGPDRGPEKEEVDADAKPRQLRRLQIAMWIQAVCGVLAGNIVVMLTFSYRSATLEDLTAVFRDRGEDDPVGMAQQFYELYQSTNYLVSSLVIGGATILASIVAVLCIVRFKSRKRAVRWWAVGATAVLFVMGMIMTTVFQLLVAPWVFASVLALWWLFASDIRRWMSD